MNPPIRLNFDFCPELIGINDSVAHLLKIYQGAPYSQSISVQTMAAGVATTRDFSGYDIQMQWRLTQASTVLLALSSDAGQIAGSTTGITFNIPAAVTAALQLPLPNANAINEIKFFHDIELLQDGLVVERFAQGTGLIVAATTRNSP